MNSKNTRLAVVLFEQDVVPLAKAAQISDLSTEEFLEVLNTLKIDVVTHSTNEIAEDLEAIREIHTKTIPTEHTK